MNMFATLRRRVSWQYPEWWTLAMSAGAWLVIVNPLAFSSASHGHHHHAGPARLGTIDALRPAGDWMLMIAAMMLPLCVASIRATADRSLWRRRHRAIATWLIGYLSVWLVVGVAFSLVAALPLFDAVSRSSTVALLVFVLAAAWQMSPLRARALRQCHRSEPLAPAGWRATRDCVRYGWTTGRHCAITCGALMLGCLLLGHDALGLIAMIAATAIGLAERYMIRPDPRWLAASILLLGTLTAL